ncbi:MAG TPA: apolipoprotein N-acyltransferase [Gemmataceae bacterium]|nr:apolipoprotein N-acyltransferase [Gemmataceae bacterium]
MPISEITLERIPQSSLVAARPSRTPGGAFVLLLSLTSGALLWLCYFPAACGWLIWIALVPLLTLVRSSARPRRIYLSAWLGGLAFYLASIQWMRVADYRMYATWIGLSFYCSLYFPLAVYLIRFLDRRTSLPLIVTVPVVWTALEYLRSTFGGGFAWYLLSHSQHTFLPLIQIADLTGAYGVSFLIAAVNALLVEILVGQTGKPDIRRGSRIGLLVQGLVVLAALIGTVGYGFWRLGQDRITPGPRIAMLQGNLDQRIRNAADHAEDAADHMTRHSSGLADLAAVFRPNLIVWPETSWPYEWVEKEGVPIVGCRKMAEDMATNWQTNLLVGMNGSTVGADKVPHRYNTAILINRQGKAAGRYDKIHRVPFGEYVPFRDWLPWMNYFAPYDFDYSVWPGEHHTRFPLADASSGRLFRFGVLICYEDTDADVSRPYGGGDDEAPADFLLNISNDGWFDGTSEHDQHLAICRFRAVECRRAVARAVNMGISALIDSNGRVLQPQEMPSPDHQFQVWSVPMPHDNPAELPVSQWHEYKKVAGVLLAIVPIDERVSLYARWGDWLPWACWIFLAAAFGFSWVRWR